MATVGPSELARLKEKALEYNRLKEQMEALKDDVSKHVTPHLPTCTLDLISQSTLTFVADYNVYVRRYVHTYVRTCILTYIVHT